MTTDRENAEPNIILQGHVGSTLFGTSVDDSDIDLMGVCCEPPECLLGLTGFEQWRHRTDPDHVRSGAGSVEGTVHSLRKWVRLVAAGNPSLMLLAFIPKDLLTVDTPLGVTMQTNVEMFRSRQVAIRFHEYMRSQIAQLTGVKKPHTKRPQLVAQHGWDVKAAYQALCMGIEGTEFLRDGMVTLPFREPDRQWLLALRRGEHSLIEVLDRAEQYASDLKQLSLLPDLRPESDRERINRWLINTYQMWWTHRGLL